MTLNQLSDAFMKDLLCPKPNCRLLYNNKAANYMLGLSDFKSQIWVWEKGLQKPTTYFSQRKFCIYWNNIVGSNHKKSIMKYWDKFYKNQSNRKIR